MSILNRKGTPLILTLKKAYLNQIKSFSISSKNVFSGKKSDQTKRKEMLFYTPHRPK